jgi:4-amino-4-deoxy-L-arabinose transferase-like glycosyltransferase
VRNRVFEIGILLLAALVRLWGLGVQSLWLDEAFSHLFATLPLRVAWQAIIVDAVHPPLYYLLLRPWLALAGGSEFALRFPSAVAGVLSVALVLQAGRRWLGVSAGWWAALLLALNPFHVWYSQEARMYALLGLLALAGLLAFWQALHDQRPRVWAVLAGVSALAYLTHYFGLYLPLVEFAFLLVTFRRHHHVLARWAVTQTVAVLPFAGWVTALYTIGGGAFGIGWIRKPQPADLLRTLWSFGVVYDGRVTWLVVAGLLIWCGLLMVGVVRRRSAGRTRLLLILALALPPLATFLLSLRRPTYVDRFFIGSLLAFLLLAAAGLAHLPRTARWTAGLALCCLGLWGVVRFHTDPIFIKEDWRGAAACIEAREAAGDVLALRQFQDVIPFRYYYHGALEPVAVTLNRQTTPVEEIAAGHERLWLIFRARHDDLHHLAWGEPFVPERDEGEPAVRAWLADHTPAEVADFSGVTVMWCDLEGYEEK